VRALRRGFGAAIVSLVTFLSTAMVARADTTPAAFGFGPCGSGPTAVMSAWVMCPKYSLPITIVDTVRRSLTGDQRRMWTRMRNGALTMWGGSLVPLKVINHVDGPVPTIGMDPNLVLPDYVYLVDLGTGCIDQGGSFKPADSDYSAGLAWVSTSCAGFWNSWNFKQMRAGIAHELGHAFGFNHPWPVQPGVMSGGWYVSDLELCLISRYYVRQAVRRACS
jgi:hypothetical protein